jgi:hypothetical protein
VALLEAGSTTGAELILEQQRQVLARGNTPAAQQQEQIELQRRINAAVLKGSGWEGIPDGVRTAADTPWFQSYLAFDPARILRDVRQPLLIVRAAREATIPAHHADRLAELGRARKRKVATDIVDDSRSIGTWLARNLE